MNLHHRAAKPCHELVFATYSMLAGLHLLCTYHIYPPGVRITEGVFLSSILFLRDLENQKLGIFFRILHTETLKKGIFLSDIADWAIQQKSNLARFPFVPFTSTPMVLHIHIHSNGEVLHFYKNPTIGALQ